MIGHVILLTALATNSVIGVGEYRDIDEITDKKYEVLKRFPFGFILIMHID